MTEYYACGECEFRKPDGSCMDNHLIVERQFNRMFCNRMERPKYQSIPRYYACEGCESDKVGEACPHLHVDNTTKTMWCLKWESFPQSFEAADALEMQRLHEENTELRRIVKNMRDDQIKNVNEILEDENVE